jgi:hypothetical protein
VSHTFSPRPSRRGTRFVSRSHRRESNRLVLEFLETRQLLSVSGADLRQIMVHPDLTAAPLVSSPSPTGLTPIQVRQAYGLNQVSFQGGTVAGDGSGQTIAIVTAYDDPNIGADLKQFDRQFGLTDPPSFTKYVQTGLTQPDPGWSLETSLDVEWAHAMAPKANLVLVEAKTASLSDVFGAVNFARSLNGVVAVSMSWGTGEFYGQWNYDPLFTTPAVHVGGAGLPGGVTFIAASGDSGAWYGTSYPSTSVNVLSVGATSLNLGANSSYVSERGWIGSTGGFSAIEPVPAYQASTQAAQGLSYGLRTTPDVSAVGDPATGVSVYDSVPYGGRTGWSTVGGTSASAPQWAGLIAVADQGLALAGRGSLANAQAALYEIPSSAFHTVTSGFNGYYASSGYNLVTGMGSPIANRVVAGLLATQNVYNVTGFLAPALGGLQLASTAQASLTLSSGGGIGTGVNTGQGSTGSTPIFPIFPPNIVIIVVPVGSTQVLVFLPAPINRPSLFASNNRPVQNQVSLSISLPSPSQTMFRQFGQDVREESLLTRPIRFSKETEVAALIDIVEPFQPAAPVPAPNKAATFSGTRATVMLPPGSLPAALPWFDVAAPVDDSPTGELPVAAEVAMPPSSELETESRTNWTASTLAGVAALAGGGYWLTLRERDSQRNKRSPSSLRSDRFFKPAMQRFSLPTIL